MMVYIIVMRVADYKMPGKYECGAYILNNKLSENGDICVYILSNIDADIALINVEFVQSVFTINIARVL